MSPATVELTSPTHCASYSTSGHGHNDDATDPLLDRSVPNPLKRWRSAAAIDGIDLSDALASLNQFGHTCG